MKLIIPSDVKEDILDIYYYIADSSIKNSNKTVDNIYYLLNKLKDYPYIGRYVPEFSEKRYRELIYKNYRIVYEVSIEEDTIFIHFIVHSKRDFKSFFNSYLSRFYKFQ